MGNKPSFSDFFTSRAGSASELDYQLLLAKDLGYLSSAEYARIADELLRIDKNVKSA